jgi:hypothetical protein
MKHLIFLDWTSEIWSKWADLTLKPNLDLFEPIYAEFETEQTYSFVVKKWIKAPLHVIQKPWIIIW